MTRARTAFLLVTALRWIPPGLRVPVAVLVMTGRGLSLSEVGVVMLAYSLAIVVLELPTGALADVLGRRPVLVAASVLNVIGLALFLAAPATPLFAAAWLLLGAGRALASGPLEAWYVDLALEHEPDRDLEADLSAHAVVTGIALAAGSLAAGALGTSGAFEAGGLLQLTAIELPVAAAVVVELLHLAAVAALIREARPQHGAGALRKALRGTPRAVVAGAGLGWRDRGIRAVLGAEVLWGVAIVAVEGLWQPRVEQLVGDVSERTMLLGLFGAGTWLVGALGAGLLPRLRRLLKGRTGAAAAVATAVQGLAVAAMALAGQVPVLLAVYLLVYTGNGASSPAHMSLLHRRVGARQRATLVSVNSLGGQLGAAAGSLTLMALADGAGIPAAWVMAGALLLASAPLYLVPDRHPATPPAAEPPAERSAGRRPRRGPGAVPAPQWPAVNREDVAGA